MFHSPSDPGGGSSHKTHIKEELDKASQKLPASKGEVRLLAPGAYILHTTS